MTTRLVLLAATVLGLAAGCGSEAAPESAKQLRAATGDRTGSSGVTVELG